MNIDKHKHYSTLAIWNRNDKRDTSIVERNLHQLNNRVVMIGLNVSASVEPYENFQHPQPIA